MGLKWAANLHGMYYGQRRYHKAAGLVPEYKTVAGLVPEYHMTAGLVPKYRITAGLS